MKHWTHVIILMIILFVFLTEIISCFDSANSDDQNIQIIGQGINPRIHSGKITWVGSGESAGDIYFWKGNGARRLTENGDNHNPCINNGQICWVYDGNSSLNADLMWWDGSSTYKIASSAYSRANPDLADGQITWNSYSDMNVSDIFLWDGNTIQTVAQGWNPVIDNGNLAWFGFYDTGRAIYFWDGSTIFHQLLATSYYFSALQLADGQITWHSIDDTDYEVYYWNTQPGETIVKITDNSDDDKFPQIDNGWITWQGFDGADTEIYLWKGASIIQITDNDFADEMPQINGGEITWQGFDGQDLEIFFWNGSSVIQITDNTTADTRPQLHNGQITWMNESESSSNICFRDCTGLY